jgi:hypothetical protein
MSEEQRQQKPTKLSGVQKRVRATKRKLIKAMAANLKIVSKACRDVGVDRSVYYEYYKNDPEFARQIDELEEVVVDFYEAALAKQANEGNAASTMYFLKCRGKKRGYSDLSRTDHNCSIELKVNNSNELTDDQLRAIATGKATFETFAAATAGDSDVDVEGTQE